MVLSLTEKKRLTRDALRDFIRALPASRYDVRIINKVAGTKARRIWTPAQLLQPETVGFLRARNAEGADVYIRPATPNYVLLDFDEDGHARLQRLIQEGVPVVLAVQTSRDGVHAWINLGPIKKVTEQEQKEVARTLAKRFQADHRSANTNQVGRAPGFFNRKPIHRDSRGYYPLVRIIPSGPWGTAKAVLAEARRSLARARASAPGAQLPYVGRDRGGDPIEVYHNGRHIVTMRPPPDLGTPNEAFGQALSWLRDDGYTAPVRDDGQTDRSLRDVDVAEFIICCEYSEQFVEEALALGSDKAQERTPDHARSYAASRVRVALERHNII